MKSRTKAFLWVLTLFLSGTLFGAALTYYFIPVRAGERLNSHEKSHRSGRPDLAEIVKSLQQRLQLRDEQVPQLQNILREGRERFKTLGQEADQKFQQARNDTRDKIRAILDPEQKKRYQEFIQEYDKQRRERHKK